jgi:outer membrane protein W
MRLCRKLPLILLAFALPALAASPALAQGRSRAFEFGIFGGSVIMDTPLLWVIGERGENDTLGGAESAEFWGGRLGYHFTPKWGVELSHDDISTEDSFYEEAQRDLITETLTLNYTFLTGSQRRAYPYVVGGVGYMTNKITVKGNIFEDSTLAYALGGGFRMYLNKAMSFRVDGRWKIFSTQLDAVDPDGPTFATVPSFHIDDTFANLEITFGLHGLFGGKK